MVGHIGGIQAHFLEEYPYLIALEEKLGFRQVRPLQPHDHLVPTKLIHLDMQQNRQTQKRVPVRPVFGGEGRATGYRDQEG